MSHITDTLRTFILTRFLPGESPENLQDTTPLQSSGILDSLAVLQLVDFVQSEFGVTLDVMDTTADRFDRLDDIAAAVLRRRTESLPA